MSCHSQRIFLTVLMFTAAACGGNEPADGAAAALPPTDVQTVTLEPKPVPRSSEFVATIRSLRSTTVQPQVEGFVRQIFVKAGDRVPRASRWSRSIPTASRPR